MRLTLTLDPPASADVDVVARVCTRTLTRLAEDDLLRQAGPLAVRACQELRTTLPGGRLARCAAVTTTAGDLPARWLLHVVAPAFDVRTPGDHLLRRTYRNVLAAAEAVGARTLTLPALGTTPPYWPLDVAVRAAVGTLLNTPTTLVETRLALRTAAGLEPFAEALARR